jgi:hypothetical protein
MSLTEQERMKLINLFSKIVVGAGCFFVLIWLLAKIPEIQEFIEVGSKDPFAIFYLIYLAFSLIALLAPFVWLVAGLYLFFAKLYKSNQANKLYYILIIPLVIIGFLFSAFNLEKINAIRIMMGNNGTQINIITKNWAVIYDYKYTQWLDKKGVGTIPILYWAAKNESTPSSTLEYLATLNVRSVNRAVANNSNTSDHVLSDLASRDTGYREIISKNRSASADTLHMIHKLETQDGRESWRVISNLFKNPNTPQDVLNDIRKKFTTEQLDNILQLKDRPFYDE